MWNVSSFYLAAMLFLVCSSCKQSGKEDTSVDPVSVATDTSGEFVHGDHVHNVGRAIWQKPGLVIDKLGDLSQKTVADIGAGTGYFSYRLAKKARKVIAIDIEQGMLDYIDSMSHYLILGPNNVLENRLANAAEPNLGKDEVDVILIINTIAYVPQLPQYLQTLKKGLKPNGTLMIIDYKMKRLPINAPPKSERIYLDKLEDMLIDGGYEIAETDDTSLDYQYILQATNVE